MLWWVERRVKRYGDELPKLAEELSAIQVRRLKRPGLHAVGGVTGLCINVKDSGARNWLLRVVVGERRREIGLGGYPTVTLEQARNSAREAHEQIRQGIDHGLHGRSGRIDL